MRDKHQPTTNIKLPWGIELNGFAVRDVMRLGILVCTILILASQFGLLPFGR